MNDDANLHPASGRSHYQLTYNERIDLLVDLALLMVEGKLPYGQQGIVAARHSVSCKTVRKMLKRLKKQERPAEIVKSGKASNTNATQIDRQAVKSAISELPLHKRRTQTSLSEDIGVSRYTIRRLINEGVLLSTRQFLKPRLTEAHRAARLAWANTLVSNDLVADDMLDIVHLDEKWFFVHHDGTKVYITEDESHPEPDAVQHKSHICKVMFLSAVARPRIKNERTQEWFDGKISLIPFVEGYITRRSTKNRPAGEWCLKTVSANRDKMREFTIMVGRAIQEKWPRRSGAGGSIKLQMDNASPHISNDDPEWLEAKKDWALDIELVRQPAQSPDLNVLDLGIWSSIQSRQRQLPMENTSEYELVKMVRKAFSDTGYRNF